MNYLNSQKLAKKIADNTNLSILIIYILPFVLLSIILDILIVGLYKFDVITLAQMYNYINLAPILAYVFIFITMMILKNIVVNGVIKNENTN